MTAPARRGKPKPMRLPRGGGPSLVDLHRLPDWPVRACRNHPSPDDFHRGDGEHWVDARRRLRATALAHCVRCPIRAMCATVGQKFGDGLWGGVAYSRLPSGRITSIDLLGGST